MNVSSDRLRSLRLRDGRGRPGGDAIDPRPSGPPKRCSNCGVRIEPGGWVPLASYTDAEGTYRIESFCGDDCRREWLADRSGAPDPVG